MKWGKGSGHDERACVCVAYHPVVQHSLHGLATQRLLAPVSSFHSFFPPTPIHPTPTHTGGHVIFSHYHYFDALLDKVNPDWCERQRVCYIWQKGRFIPYPYQNNIHRLPPEDFQKCMDGLTELEAQRKQQQQKHEQQSPSSLSSSSPVQTKPRNFLEWLQNGFGQGILDLFMVPYNRKVWGYVQSSSFFFLSKEIAGRRLTFEFLISLFPSSMLL